jgi:hypothetical protein
VLNFQATFRASTARFLLASPYVNKQQASWGTAALWSALSVGLVTSVACGGDDNATGKLETPVAGATAVAGDSRASCEHYFDAQFVRCGGPRLVAAELARIRSRFHQVCVNQIALRGSGITARSLESCAAALDVSPCQAPDGPPVACDFHGTLSGGAACSSGVQCSSGRCDDMQLITPGGPIGPLTCGTCAPAVDVGQVCAQGTFSGGCHQGAICVTADTTAAEPRYSCIEVVQQDTGEACERPSIACKPGLYCSTQTNSCKQLGVLDAACGDGPIGQADCTAPYICGSRPGTCRSGAAGATCLTDDECTPGFGCIPADTCAGPGQTARIGCATSGRCVPIEWAAPGAECGGSTRCTVGVCDFGGGRFGGGPPHSTDGGATTGVCPPVVPDGEPCTTASTCDTFSECFEEKCVLRGAAVCK